MVAKKMKRDKFGLSRRDKLIVFSLLSIPFLLMLFYVVNALFDSRTTRDFYLEDKKIESYHGVIDSIFHQKRNHNIKTLVVGEKWIGLHSSWENKFRVGDSVSKYQGSLQIQHFRNGELIETLDYNDVIKF